MKGKEMKTVLRFNGNGKQQIELVAETDAEKAILAFLSDGYDKRWEASPRYTYRAGGVDSVTLSEVPMQSLP